MTGNNTAERQNIVSIFSILHTILLHIYYQVNTSVLVQLLVSFCGKAFQCFLTFFFFKCLADVPTAGL